MTFIKYHFNNFHYSSAKFPLCFQKLCFWKTKVFSFFVKKNSQIFKFSKCQSAALVSFAKAAWKLSLQKFSEETISSTNFSKKRNQKSEPIKFKKCQHSKYESFNQNKHKNTMFVNVHLLKYMVSWKSWATENVILCLGWILLHDTLLLNMCRRFNVNFCIYERLLKHVLISFNQEPRTRNGNYIATKTENI